MKGSLPLPTPTDGVYNMNYFATDDATEGVSTVVDKESATVTVTLANAGDSLTLAIPDSVDVNHLVDIT